QEYIRRQLEEEQRHLEILQQQLLQEQAMLLEYRWREMEEHRHAERLQRQLQQEQKYLMSLQQPQPQQAQPQQPSMPQQDRSKQSYHGPETKAHYEQTERVREAEERLRKATKGSPEAQSKQTGRALEPSVPSRSESFSNGNSEPAQPAMHRPVEPQVPVRTTSRSPVLSRRDSPLQGSVQQNNQSGQRNSTSNIEPRLLWERVEKLVPRPGSGSSSGSSNSGSQAGSHPGSQSGSGERFRMRSSSKSEGSPSQRPENTTKKTDEKKDTGRPGKPADLTALAKELRAVEDVRPLHKVTDYSSSSEDSGTTDEEDDDMEQEGADESTSGPEDARAMSSLNLSNGETESVKTMIVHDDVESEPAMTPSKEGTLIVRQSTVDKKRANQLESNGFAGRIHLLPDLLQQSHSSSTTSSPSSSQPTPTMSPQTPQDKLTANETQSASNTLQKHKSSSSFTPFIDPRLLQISPSSGTTVTSVGTYMRTLEANLKNTNFILVGFSSEALRPDAMRQDPTRKGSVVNVNPTNTRPQSDTPEIRKYKKRFNSEILCAALW
ncbi:hypothetical protein AB205_0012960, partial [Aquarana catesbeiana]